MKDFMSFPVKISQFTHLRHIKPICSYGYMKSSIFNAIIKPQSILSNFRAKQKFTLYTRIFKKLKGPEFFYTCSIQGVMHFGKFRPSTCNTHSWEQYFPNVSGFYLLIQNVPPKMKVSWLFYNVQGGDRIGWEGHCSGYWHFLVFFQNVFILAFEDTVLPIN